MSARTEQVNENDPRQALKALASRHVGQRLPDDYNTDITIRQLARHALALEKRVEELEAANDKQS